MFGAQTDRYKNDGDLHAGANWYVVHTYSGHENKVKANIEKIVENRGMGDVILKVEVPTETLVEVKDGKKKEKQRKIFPGYVIVKMYMNDQSWYVVRNTRGVTGFVGAGTKPTPLTRPEVENMGLEKRTVLTDYQVGDNVMVVSGPFEKFVGVVEEIHTDKQSVKVLLSMFGRETPVELEFEHVTRI
ncbi:MAG: transcription termination/antitermination protein NusG [Bacillota bacterium]|nr:transcription termination/antitermination protein NusG [Bacillota bacterium]